MGKITRFSVLAIGAMVILLLAGCGKDYKGLFAQLQAAQSGLEANKVAAELMQNPDALSKAGIQPGTVEQVRSGIWEKEGRSHLAALKSAMDPQVAVHAKSDFTNAVREARLTISRFGETEDSLDGYVGRVQKSAATQLLAQATSNRVYLAPDEAKRFAPPPPRVVVKKVPVPARSQVTARSRRQAGRTVAQARVPSRRR